MRVIIWKPKLNEIQSMVKIVQTGLTTLCEFRISKTLRWPLDNWFNRNCNIDATGTCFIQKIYAPSSSLLQGKHIPFSSFLLWFNMFRLFVILSLTQLYRYTPEIFLFSTATFRYTYRSPSDELEKNIQRTLHFLLLSHWNGYYHLRFALDFSYAFGILYTGHV